jgi:uncharacterized protein YbcI
MSHVGFFCFHSAYEEPASGARMTPNNLTMAEEIGLAASAFEQIRTGHVPKSVTVVLHHDTLVITLRGVLTNAERVLANTEDGAARVREYHRQLFASTSGSLIDEIKRITGASANESPAINGTTVPIFESGAVVHVFVLAAAIPLNVWNGETTAVHLPVQSHGSRD